MKKMLSILMAILVVTPLLGVKAIEGNYYTYGVGDEVNFYMYEGDKTGSRTIILDDEGPNSKYVRAWVTGIVFATSDPWAEEIDLQGGVDPADFKQMPGYAKLQNVINQKLNGAGYVRDVQNETSLITLEDLERVFGATKQGDIYTLDWAKCGSAFSKIPTSAAGFYTQTLSEDKKSIWVVEFVKNAAAEVTGASVKLVPIDKSTGSTTTSYAYIPVLYADKTYDCTERESTEKFACYECNDEYIWEEIGKQADYCKKIDKVKVQSSCVKNVKTGIDEYFIQFGIVAGICVLALVAVNRKNLFKSV